MLLLYLFLLFTVVPLVEITLLYYVGQAISWPATVGLVLLTGLVGVTLARWQGVRAVLRVHRRIARGQVPASELFDGLLILFAGLLLVTPGLLTDLLGFSLLIPPLRNLLKRGLSRWARRQVDRSAVDTDTYVWTHPGGSSPGAEGVEVEVLDRRVVD